MPRSQVNCDAGRTRPVPCSSKTREHLQFSSVRREVRGGKSPPRDPRGQPCSPAREEHPMRTTNTKKLIGAAAVAAVVAAGGSAFTGTGVTDNAAASQFVGGTVSQSITGATLNDISYHFTDA